MSTRTVRRAIVMLAAGAALMVCSLAAVSQAEAATLYACVKKNGTARIYSKKPKCKKGESKLSWNTAGPKGPAGSNGAAGATGPTGKEGPPGFSALSTLPTGDSESGDYGASSITAEFFTEGVTFPIPLASDVTHVGYSLLTSTKTTSCPGPGRAAAGWLCVYSGEHSEIEPPSVFNYEVNPGKEGETGRYGFILEWESDGGSSFRAYDAGTWTVTAP